MPVASGLGDIAMPQAAAPAMPAQGGAPMNIVPEGAPPAQGGGGLADKLRAMLGGGAPAQGGGGFDFGNFLTDTGAGLAASGDWRLNPFQALGAGVSGAAASQNERSSEERKRALQDMQITDKREDRKFKIEDRSYQRERDKIRDARDDRNFNETSAERADMRKYRKTAEERAGQAHELNMVKATQEVMRGLSPDLTLDQRLKVENAVSSRLKTLIGDTVTAEPGELKALTEQVRNEIMGTPALSAPATPTAAGTQEDPHKPADQTTFDALPSGAWFINPADGRLLRKK